MLTTMTMRTPLGALRLYADCDELVGVDLPGCDADAGVEQHSMTGESAKRSSGEAARTRMTGESAKSSSGEAARTRMTGESAKRDVLVRTAEQLAEYFAGERRVFDLPLAPRGTGFQTRVWRTLLHIPYGETWSYGELARAIGRPAASRAMGAANGRNPIPIIVPCHRVIGANGSLTGYGGGLPIKRWLLDHERSWRQPSLPGARPALRT